MNIPKFITAAITKKYNLKIFNIDLEVKIKDAGLGIHNWGRINASNARINRKLQYSDEKQLADCIFHLIDFENLNGRITIVWSNSTTPAIESGIDFLHDFFSDIVSEDWDFWIFGDKDWIMENYHEGELCFIRL